MSTHTIAANSRGHRMRAVLASLCLAITLGIAPVAAQIISVPNDDAAMEAAITKAQASLPVFWETIAKPQPGDDRFAVKIKYATGSKSGEHIWAGDVKRAGANVTATISNTPRDIPNLKKGQRVTVPLDRVTDWMFFRNDKIHGAQTLRVLLARMPPDQAADWKSKLAPE
jgi:uncharacterized protein YegJ (DUF2314 family)